MWDWWCGWRCNYTVGNKRGGFVDGFVSSGDSFVDALGGVNIGVINDTACSVSSFVDAPVGGVNIGVIVGTVRDGGGFADALGGAVDSFINSCWCRLLIVVVYGWCCWGWWG